MTRKWLAAATLLVSCASFTERRDAALRHAEDAQRAGHPERAEEILRWQLRADPRDALIVTRLASVLLSAGRPAEARQALDEIPEDVRTGIDYQRARAQALVASNDFDEAIVALAALDAQGRSDTEAWERLVRRLADQTGGRAVDEAIDRLPAAHRRRLIELWLHDGHLDSAASILERLAPDDARERLVDDWLDRAMDPMDVGVLSAHKTLLLPASSAPKLVALHAVLASQKRWDDAGRVEKDLLARFPDHPATFAITLSRARRLIRAGAAGEGLAAASAAVRLDPTRPDALLERALALDALDRKDDAVKSFQMALALDGSIELARRYVEDHTAKAERGGAVGSFTLSVQAAK